MNNCILASSSLLVLGNCASQFVNNLQILRTEQAFVLDFLPHQDENLSETAIQSWSEKKVAVKI